MKQYKKIFSQVLHTEIILKYKITSAHTQKDGDTESKVLNLVV